MQKFTAGAAFAAALSLALAPAAATDSIASPRLPAIFAQPATIPVAGEAAPVAAVASAPTISPEAALHEAIHAGADLPRSAPGQEREDFAAWMERSPANRDAVIAFYTHLHQEGVEDVVPVWQLTRTSSSWRQCGADRFEVAPRDKWDNVVRTLKFVDRNVVPAVGRVQAVSGYRNERLNRCSRGAPASAHRHFYALDLVPANTSVSRGDLVRQVCAAHNRDGQSFNTGLGFYNGVRFHVDSNGFRRWGANGSSATSPCGRFA